MEQNVQQTKPLVFSIKQDVVLSAGGCYGMGMGFLVWGVLIWSKARCDGQLNLIWLLPVGMFGVFLLMFLFASYLLLFHPVTLELQGHDLTVCTLFRKRTVTFNLLTFFCYRYTNLHAAQWLILSKTQLNQKQLRRLFLIRGFRGLQNPPKTVFCINCAGMESSERIDEFFSRVAELSLKVS